MMYLFVLVNTCYALNFPELSDNFKAKYRKIETINKVKSTSSGDFTFQNGTSLILSEVEPIKNIITVSDEKIEKKINGKILFIKDEYLSSLYKILLYIVKKDKNELSKIYKVKQSGSFFTLTPLKKIKNSIKKIELKFGRNKSKVIVENSNGDNLLFDINDYK